VIERKILVELPFDTYQKYFEKERIESIVFPLKPNCFVSPVDLDKIRLNEVRETLFRFFSFNIGRKVEVITMYGLEHKCKDILHFVIGGNITEYCIKVDTHLSTIDGKYVFGNTVNYDSVISVRCLD
jgi:hypothetical protein